MPIEDIAKLAAAIGAGLVLIAYAVLIAAPSWTAYGRTWEKISAAVLSLYVLVAMLVVGALIGLAIFFTLGPNV